MKLDLSQPFDINRAKVYFKKLLDGGKCIELSEHRKSRTVKQNKYLHVCISLFAIEFGYNLEEAKTHLKRNCDFMRYDKDQETFLKRTRTLDTKELTDFIEWIRTYSAKEGCHIPSADEYLAQQFEIDKTISQHKEYL